MAHLSGVARRPVVLVILDGFGTNPSKVNNAVLEASTPFLDHYFSRYPHTVLNASGSAVGLPDGQMGNSEVGHLCLGAGEIIRQDIMQINQAIDSGDFFSNDVLLSALSHAKSRKRPLHLLGLVSDGGVHSHIKHLLAIIKACKQHQVKPFLHMITDGRDTPPQSALKFLSMVEPALGEAGGAVATVCGRYYAMDRDKRWDRTERAWRAYMHGKGEKALCARTAIRSAYNAGDGDEFIRPIVLPEFTAMHEDDAVLSFNFRKDRPRQIVAAIAEQDFSGFDRGKTGLPKMFCMMPYSKNAPFEYMFRPEQPHTTLGEIVSTMGLAQFHCAETEKYAHVTYFFNGGRNEPYSGEKQLLIPSPDVATYDLKPEMSAAEVSDAVIHAISTARYAFIVVNFANGDMVGHTAKKPAVISAIEALDKEVGRLLEAAESAGYSVVLTADHGNCEEIIDPASGISNTQHTTFPVPCMVMDSMNWKLSCEGGISNIAPTVLQLMGIPQPAQMPAHSILLESFERSEKVSKSRPLKVVA